MSKFVRWLPALLWATMIFLLSSMSWPPSPGPQFRFKDKVGHCLIYAGLGCLVARSARGAHNLSLPKTVTLAILITSAYGVSDEFHQQFVPHRACELSDWVADTLGGIAGAAAFYAYETAKANRRVA